MTCLNMMELLNGHKWMIIDYNSNETRSARMYVKLNLVTQHCIVAIGTTAQQYHAIIASPCILRYENTEQELERTYFGEALSGEKRVTINVANRSPNDEGGFAIGTNLNIPKT